MVREQTRASVSIAGPATPSDPWPPCTAPDVSPTSTSACSERHCRLAGLLLLVPEAASGLKAALTVPSLPWSCVRLRARAACTGVRQAAGSGERASLPFRAMRPSACFSLMVVWRTEKLGGMADVPSPLPCSSGALDPACARESAALFTGGGCSKRRMGTPLKKLERHSSTLTPKRPAKP